VNREELLKNAKPILFNTEMVQATLEGRKTATRRIMKPQPLFKTSRKYIFADETCPKKFEDCDNIFDVYQYQVGDILYVRETFCEVPYEYEHIPMENGHITVPKIAYRADSKIDYTGIWKPSIHMPKELARIFLKVTNVRVERLQDMSIQDMINEGVKASDITTNRGVIEYRVVNRFEELWDSTVKKKDLDKYGFGANPWVWVIEFERVEVENE
jgi:hypothetical protein